MKWSFFQNLGGQESGFHDAGVETFKGNLERYLAREVIQNSLDARDDSNKPVLVRFELLQLAASSIPDFKNLAATFVRCADYWKGVQKTKEFFERAQKLARAKTVTALRIGDFNRKGYDRTCWYAFADNNVRKQAQSSKPVYFKVLGGLLMNGIIPNPWAPIKVENFLQKIYDAGGKPYFDVVNIHPYVLATKEQGPAYEAKLVRDTVLVMEKNGDGQKPLWITETGLGTGNGVTEQMQAEHLRGINEEMAKIPQVKAIYWFLLRDMDSIERRIEGRPGCCQGVDFDVPE